LLREQINVRPSRSTEARSRIIRAAADLFHKQGVNATGPDQVIEASGTGKGQFYHYFRNKQGLVHEVLQTHLAAIKSDSALVQYNIHSWQDLDRWFLAHLELQKRFQMTRGCPFGTIGNEVTENDELIRQDLNLIFEVMKGKLAAFFVREKAQGRLARSAAEDGLAEFCIAAVQGAMLMGKIKRDARVVQTAIGETLAHLKTCAVVSGQPEREN
jgi:TetR/AcrR family transcriptional regulator, transcriptional repressor for nem operon